MAHGLSPDEVAFEHARAMAAEEQRVENVRHTWHSDNLVYRDMSMNPHDLDFE